MLNPPGPIPRGFHADVDYVIEAFTQTGQVRGQILGSPYICDFQYFGVTTIGSCPCLQNIKPKQPAWAVRT